MTEDAIENAQAWYDEIVQWLREFVDTNHPEAERNRPRGLSYEVRSDWVKPDQDLNDAGGGEYRILLGTGGPALRIVGELDNYRCPESARLEWQHWFKPWTKYPLDDETPVLRYAQWVRDRGGEA